MKAFLSLTVILCLTTYTRSCSDYIYTPDIQERMDNAEVVLYGEDVTDEYECKGDPASCGRRKITFNVHCVMKSGPGTVPTTITIGPSDSMDAACGVNVLSYNSRNEMMVLIRQVSEGVYEWDSQPGLHAFYLIESEAAAEDAAKTCTVADFLTMSSASPCPVLRDQRQDCETYKVCPPPYFRSGDSCYRVTKKTDMSREKAEDSCGDSRLASFSSEEEWEGVAEVLSAGEWWIGPWYQGEGEDRQLVYKNSKGATAEMPFGIWQAGTPGDGMYVTATKEGWKTTSSDTENSRGAICQTDAVVPMPLLTRSIDRRLFQLEYKSPGFNMYICCNGATYERKELSLNSGSSADNVISPGFIRHQPQILMKVADASKYYTLVMADITGARGKATPTRPYIQWLVMDIQAPSADEFVNLTLATELLEYTSPKPTTDKNHTIVAFLYEQKGAMYDIEEVEREIAKFSDDNCLRCEFYLKVFEDVIELKLADTISFKSKMDGYAAKELILAGAHPGDTCSKIWDDLDIRGNEVVCDWAPPKHRKQTSSGVITRHTTSLLLLSSLFVLSKLMEV